MRLLAIDPGRDKCGIAVLENKDVLMKEVLPTVQFFGLLNQILEQYQPEKIILGDRTFSAKTKEKILAEAKGKWKGQIILVDEHLSTQQARTRYFLDNPPRGLKRLIPLTLQTPPEPYDHYVALILAERYLNQVEE